MAERRELPIVTDDPIYQPLIRGFQVQRNIYGRVRKTDTGHAMASLVIEAALPEDIKSASIQQVVKFRRKHDAERHRFYKEIGDLVEDIPQIDNQDAFRDCLNHHKREVDEAVSDRRLSLRDVGINCVTGLLGLSVPSWATSLAQARPELQMQIATAGVVCAAAGILIRRGVNYYKSRRRSPWSYVLSLEHGLDSKSFLRRLL